MGHAVSPISVAASTILMGMVRISNYQLYKNILTLLLEDKQHIILC